MVFRFASIFSSTVDAGDIGVILESLVHERECPFDVGDDAAVRTGESISVTVVHCDASETPRRRTEGPHE